MENKVIDLFAGCGGFSVGFERAGFSIVKAVEIDKQIANTYIKNHRSTKVYVNDIGEIDNASNFNKSEADVIIGGPPCQGFSMSGARIRSNGFIDDPRNYLFKHYVEMVKIIRPKVFLFENVKGILSMKGGCIFKEIIKALTDKENFEGDKYFLHWRVVKATDYGIPEKRERVIILGVLNHDVDLDEIDKIITENIKKEHPHFFDVNTVKDAIYGMPHPSKDGIVENNPPLTEYQKELHSSQPVIYNHIATRHIKKAIDRMHKVKDGENWTVLNEDIKSVHSGSYGRLSWDEPATTITTRFDTPSGGRYTHPVEDRTLTPREAARIQSFPDDFIFYGTKSSICKQIGNAVPPKLAFYLANIVKYILSENNE